MAFVASPGMTRPGGYSSAGQTAHDADADGYLEFFLKLKNYITGTPELDYNGSGAGITVVGTTDSTIQRSTLEGGPTIATGTYEVRRLNGTTLRITDPGAGTTDVVVTWGTDFYINPTDNIGSIASPLSFRLDDTGADPLADGEGWDLEFVANGLPAADAWFVEHRANRQRGGPAGSDDVFGEYIIRGRRTAGETNPASVPLDNQFFAEWMAIEDESQELYQTRSQWVTDPTSVAYDLTSGGGTVPPVLGSLVRCPMWRETGVSGARTIPYYIVATARYFAYVVLIDGDWFGGYVGLLDAFSTTEQYPLPFLNGGCAINATTIFTDQDREVSWAHISNDVTASESNLYWRTPEGILETVKTPFVDSGGGPGSNTVVSSQNSQHQTWPWGCNATHTTETGVEKTFPAKQQPSSVGVESSNAQPLRGAIDGSKVFIPATLIEASQGAGIVSNRRSTILGQIPFVFWTNGFGVSAGDIINTGGRDFALVQNVYRTAEQGFWALELA